MAGIFDFLNSLPKRGDVTPEELAARRQGYADLFQDGLLARNRDEMPASVNAVQASQDFIPGIGDALALGEAYDAASRGELMAAGLLGTGAAIGLVPGAGDMLARPIMAAGRKAAERLNQTGPVPTMYSNPLMGGGASDPTQTGWTFKDMDKSLNSIATKADNRRISGDTSRIEEVPINQLFATQPSVNPDFATTSSSAGEVPLVVRKNGKMFVQDGHHRLTKKAEDGSQTAKVRFLDLDDADTSTPLLDWSPEKTGFVEADNDLLDALFSPSLPSPRNEAEAMAKQVLEMRAAGNAGDVTDDMMAMADDTYMFNNTPLDMSAEGRMGRAGDLTRDYFHGSNADIGGFDRSTRGTFLSSNPDVSDSYVNRDGGQIYPVAVRGGEGFPVVDGGGALFNRIPESGLPDEFEYMKYDNNGRPFNTDFVVQASAQDGSPGVVFDSIIDRGPNIKTYLGETAEEALARASRASLPSDVTNVIFPHNIRSIFARNDPEFKHLRNLSAGVGGVGLLNAMMEEEQRQKQGLLQ